MTQRHSTLNLFVLETAACPHKKNHGAMTEIVSPASSGGLRILGAIIKTKDNETLQMLVDQP